jgi:hypothetical protein
MKGRAARGKPHSSPDPRFNVGIFHVDVTFFGRIPISWGLFLSQILKNRHIFNGSPIAWKAEKGALEPETGCSSDR